MSRVDGGPDSALSLEPGEFKQLVADCKSARRAIGKVSYDLLGSERASKPFRRSLYAVRAIAKGEKLTHDNARSIRPGLGLAPQRLPEILGRVAARDVAYGEPLTWEMMT